MESNFTQCKFLFAVGFLLRGHDLLNQWCEYQKGIKGLKN
jgi:hypothetical protein